MMPSSTSRSFVQKKAALTMLRLFRKHPDVIPATDWAERVIALMDEYDLVCKRLIEICCINMYSQRVAPSSRVLLFPLLLW